jgi:hypothetical protein
MTSLDVEANVVQELMWDASFRTTMDSYTQALDEPKRQALGRPDHADRKSRSSVIVVERCGIIAADLL